MGDFLAQVAQRLLAHHLRHDYALRLVGDHVVGEILGAFRHPTQQGLEQLLQARLLPGGYGQPGLGRIGGKLLQQGRQNGRIHGVDLVDHHGHRHRKLGVLLHDLQILLAYVGGVQHHQHGVHVLQGALHGLDHILAQAVARGVNAGGIQEDDLRLGPGEHAHDAAARGLRARGGDGDLLAHQRVHQRGLAHVRPSQNRHKSRLIALALLFFHRHTVRFSCFSKFHSFNTNRFDLRTHPAYIPRGCAKGPPPLRPSSAGGGVYPAEERFSAGQEARPG